MRGETGDIKGLSNPTNIPKDERKEGSSVTQAVTLIGESSINPWMTPTFNCLDKYPDILRLGSTMYFAYVIELHSLDSLM